MRVVFVHGACVKDGSWWWHRTAELLAERGIASEALALPSCGETGGSPNAGGPGLSDDVAAVRQVLTASDEPTVVVAHSYGGIVTAEAAAGVDAVRHLLLISSYLPEIGQSLSSFGGETPAPFLDIDPAGGTFTVKLDAVVETFLQDCDQQAQHEVLNKLARQSVAVLGQPVKAAAWQNIASTYLVCTEDRGTPVERQRTFAARASRVVELDVGHHPFISQPAAVRDLILGLGTATTDVRADIREALLQAYAAFNRKDMEALLARISDDVNWPDDNGGRLHGKEAVRPYWAEQWTRVLMHDEPVSFEQLADSRVAVRVSQVARSLDGSVISESSFLHIHRMEGTRISRMDIRNDHKS